MVKCYMPCQNGSADICCSFFERQSLGFECKNTLAFFTPFVITLVIFFNYRPKKTQRCQLTFAFNFSKAILWVLNDKHTSLMHFYSN
jgi:hypothetical protein